LPQGRTIAGISHNPLMRLVPAFFIFTKKLKLLSK